MFSIILLIKKEKFTSDLNKKMKKWKNTKIQKNKIILRLLWISFLSTNNKSNNISESEIFAKFFF
jgi:hypothetical protein